MPETTQKSQKGNLSYKKVRTCGAEKNPYNEKYRERNRTLNTEMEVKTMALSNLFGWNKTEEAAPAAACGTACGAGNNPEEKPAACSSACGAGDKPEEKPAACGSACGAGDK